MKAVVFYCDPLATQDLNASGFCNDGSNPDGWLPVSIAAFMLVIIIAYTAAGGLAAVAWTDVIMVIGMTFGCIFILFQIFGDMSIGTMLADNQTNRVME